MRWYVVTTVAFLLCSTLLAQSVMGAEIPAQTLGNLTIIVTTNPVKILPSDATLLIRIYRNGQPAANEQVDVRLAGNKHVRFNTNVIADANGMISISTYFSNAGEYTLAVSNRDGTVSFPIEVRGTTVLVTGLLAASAVLLALLFERKLHR